MSTSPSLNKEREAFEAWRRRTTKMDPDGAVALDGMGDDAGYANKITRVMHIAWMARAASTPSALPVEGAAITSEKSTEVKEAERDSMFTPGHEDFERRQTFTAPVVGSWPWLRGCINGIPKREELLGGQRTRYVQLDEVLGWIDEGERRAALASPAIVGTPSKEGAGQVEAVPEGCTPTDARVLREANHWFASENHRLREALEFYAEGNHFVQYDPNAWDTVSGEPANFYEDEANTATVEDGSIAKLALATPPASPSEGGVEQIAHIKQAIYTISGGDFDATDDEARRIAEAVLSLSPSRGAQ